MSRKKKDSNTETLSVTELKAWIRGIQEFQPKNWTPNQEQWENIVKKIFALDESTPVAQPQQSQAVVEHSYETYPAAPQRYFDPVPVPSAFDPAAFAPQPSVAQPAPAAPSDDYVSGFR